MMEPVPDVRLIWVGLAIVLPIWAIGTAITVWLTS